MWRVGLLYRVCDLLAAVEEEAPDSSSYHRALRTFRGVRLDDLLRVAEAGGWMIGNGTGRFELTDSGRVLLGISEPAARLRFQIAALLSLTKPVWAATAARGRQALAQYVPTDVVQCFREAGLLDGDQAEVVEWWDRIASQYRSAREILLVDIGRSGERLCVEAETVRTGVRPKWIAIDVADAGYDVLSRVSRDDPSPLLIEVKTTQGSWNHASFFLSRNEWEVLNGGAASVVQLWCVRGRSTLCANIEIGMLAQHVCVDHGAGIWTRLRCPYSVATPHEWRAAGEDLRRNCRAGNGG